MSLPSARDGATSCSHSVCPRWSESPETYRITVTNQEWPTFVDEFFGPAGDGVGGKFGVIPFPIKHRSAAAGGDWTATASKEKRPLKGTSIMAKGKMVVTKVMNVYIPLQDKLLVNGCLPSGWQEEDLHFVMMVNLQNALKARTVSTPG